MGESGPELLLSKTPQERFAKSKRSLRLRVDKAEERADKAEMMNRRDPKTGLLNEVAFEEDFSEFLQGYKRTIVQQEIREKVGEDGLVKSDTRIENRENYFGLGVIYLDQNGLREVNNQLDHYKGDKLLQTAAAAIRLSVRPTDKVYRLGKAADEFVVLVRVINEEVLKRVVYGDNKDNPGLIERVTPATRELVRGWNNVVFEDWVGTMAGGCSYISFEEIKAFLSKNPKGHEIDDTRQKLIDEAEANMKVHKNKVKGVTIED